MKTQNEMPPLDAAQVGKMFVTHVSFQYHEGESVYNDKTHAYEKGAGKWVISAQLSDRPSRYGGEKQTMTLEVEQGIGQKLAEVLLPVIVADASRKAEQLAADSKAMLQALGDRTLACIADMPPAPPVE